MLQKLTLAQAQQYTPDDPVRAHIDAEFRTSSHREMWGLFEDQYAVAHTPRETPLAIICVAYTKGVPTNELELEWFSTSRVDTTTAVFYTVWSYERGAGQAIVNSVAQRIHQTRPEIDRWVTLSPLTQMAERFHTKNGAVRVAVYDSAQTFEYTHLIRDSERARSALR